MRVASSGCTGAARVRQNRAAHLCGRDGCGRVGALLGFEYEAAALVGADAAGALFGGFVVEGYGALQHAGVLGGVIGGCVGAEQAQ